MTIMQKRLATLVVAVAGLMLWFAGPAFAQGQGEQVGENLGGLLGGWARSLYVGIAALVALVFLLNRRFADLAIFVLAAIVVGGFVLAPGDVAGTVRDIWQTVTG